MNLTDLAFLNPLDIPLNSIGGYASIMKLIAFPILGAMFVTVLVQNQVSVIKGEESQLQKILVKTGLIILGLVLYRHLYTKIVAINEIIGMTLCNQSDYAKFQTILTSFASQKANITFTKVSVEGLIASITIFGAVLAQTVFGIIRYFILAILYVVGPLALVAGLMPATAGMTKGWFRKVLQVSFWIVVLKAIESIMLALRMEQVLNSDAGTFAYLVVSGVMLVMIVLIPTLSEAILSDANMGAIASAATGIMTAYGTKAAMASWKGSKASVTGAHAFAAAASNHPWTQAVKNRLSSFKKPAAPGGPSPDNSAPNNPQPKR